MILQNIKNITIIILCAGFITSCNQSISYKRPQILTNFGSFECETKKLANRTYKDIWDKTRSGFCLDTVYSPRVDKEIQWFMNNKDFLYRSIERAKPFLYHVIVELERNNLPFELALLPIVESGYQPYAYSPSKAAGIWQFIPPTAREYGLKKNWWYDGRRDIFASTKAASHFLKDMKRHFKGDWLLAIASYNTGAGNVGKSIKKANYTLGNKTFWDLNLPRETEIYVPKLIALRDIIANPTNYGVNIPKLPNKPITKFVKIKHPIDFYTISILSGVDEAQIHLLNPGFSAWYFLPTMQKRLLLPTENAKVFQKRYSKLIRLIYSNQTHLVEKGDSLSKISRIYNVSIKSIMLLNNLKSDLIRINQKLKLPIEGITEDKNQIKIGNSNYKIIDKSIIYSHKVKRYDNWYKIARRYNTNLKTLLSWNNANKKTKLKVGEIIKIKMKSPVLSRDNNIKLRYVVDLGDTVRDISTGFGVSEKSLLSDNNIKNSRSLRAGTNLTIYK
tara:strand:- start:773 stop:2281 length:1509 start_codon:yes stop_codon:yes gene_type:complete